MKRLFLTIAAALLAPLAAHAQSTKADLRAATAAGADGKPEVRLRVRITEGWLPPEGVRIYRSIDGKKTLVYESKPVDDNDADGALDPAVKGRKLWSAAARPMQTETPLSFRALRPPSTAQKFMQSKAISDEVRQSRQAPAPQRMQVKAQAATKLKALRAPAAAGGAARAPLARPGPALNDQDKATFDARAKLAMSALLNKDAAPKLGLGATDDGPKKGDRLTYTLVAVKGGKDGATLDTVTLSVGDDPQPPAPADLVWQQILDDDGDPLNQIALRWARLDAALEEQLLTASYLIERRDTDEGRPTPAPRTARNGAAAPSWTRVHKKPIVIIAINGDEEPTSFFSDAVPEPGAFKYRVALVDGFGRQSAWADVDISAADWREPDAPGGPAAELITEVAHDRGGRAPQREVIGLKRSGFAPKQLGDWSAGILAGRVRPSVQVSWRPVRTPGDLTTKYSIWRSDADDPKAAPVLVTPQPVEGDLLPLSAEQTEAKQASDRLVAEVAAARALLSRLPDNQRDSAEATLRAKIAELHMARLLAAQRRGWTDTSVKLDAKYRYTVRAIFQPSGLDSEDALSGIVSVPTPALPAKVDGLRFAGFTPTAQLPADQRADDTPGSKSRRPRLAPTPSGFKAAGAAPAKSFALSGNVRGTKPAAAGQPVLRRVQPPASQPGFSPRVPILGAEAVSKLKLNLAHSRDDGGVARLEWTASPLRSPTYQIRRRSGQEEFVDVGTTSATTFRDVLPRSMARKYEYQVVAVSRWGIAGHAANTAADIPCTLRPSEPNILGAAPDDTADRAIRVRIGPSDPDESVTAYKILRDGAPAGEVQAAGTSEIAFIDQGRDPAKTHRYSAVAVNPAGSSEASRTVAASAMKLTADAPANLRAAAGAKGVTLTWTAASGTSYTVQRRAGQAAVILSGSVKAGTLLDASAIAGVAYTYEVSATDTAGNVSAPASATITP